MPERPLPKRYLEAGIHTQRFSADMWGVDPNVLKDPDKLDAIATDVCNELGLKIIGEYTHLYAPDDEIPGSTGLKVLSQSSYIWHDWAEHEYLAVDAHTCSPNVNLRRARRILIKHYNPRAIDFRYFRPREPLILLEKETP